MKVSGAVAMADDPEHAFGIRLDAKPLELVHAVRSGMKLVYAGQPGEIIALMNDGRAVVAHRERPPKIINVDGTEEPFVWNVLAP